MLRSTAFNYQVTSWSTQNPAIDRGVFKYLKKTLDKSISVIYDASVSQSGKNAKTYKILSFLQEEQKNTDLINRYFLVVEKAFTGRLISVKIDEIEYIKVVFLWQKKVISGKSSD